MRWFFRRNSIEIYRKSVPRTLFLHLCIIRRGIWGHMNYYKLKSGLKLGHKCEPSYLLISQATRPFISMTSDGLAKPSRLNTLFLHLSLSICRTVRAFFNSRLAVRTSAAIWNAHTHTHTRHHETESVWGFLSHNCSEPQPCLLGDGVEMLALSEGLGSARVRYGM